MNPAKLRRGDVVYALRDLREGDAVIYRYATGVVFEEAAPGTPAMVCFPVARAKLPVGRGDVIEASAYAAWQAKETVKNEKKYAKQHLAACKVALATARKRLRHARGLS